MNCDSFSTNFENPEINESFLITWSVIRGREVFQKIIYLVSLKIDCCFDDGWCFGRKVTQWWQLDSRWACWWYNYTQQYYHHCPWSKNLPSRRMKTHQSLTSSVCVLVSVPLKYIAPLLHDFISFHFIPALFVSCSFMLNFFSCRQYTFTYLSYNVRGFS